MRAADWTACSRADQSSAGRGGKVALVSGGRVGSGPRRLVGRAEMHVVVTVGASKNETGAARAAARLDEDEPTDEARGCSGGTHGREEPT